MRVFVELPQGWGPGQLIITEWLHAGYHVEEHRSMAAGTRYLTVRGSAERRPAVSMRYGHIPRVCPYGHELRAGRVLVGWTPCLCPPAGERYGGHRTYTCEDCRTEHGTLMICYLPEHVTA